MSLRELEVEGTQALKVADALTSTSYKIMRLISVDNLDVSTIAKKLGLSEAYVSEQIRILEDLNLIYVRYERGIRGIRKICLLAVKKVIFIISPLLIVVSFSSCRNVTILVGLPAIKQFISCLLGINGIFLTT